MSKQSITFSPLLSFIWYLFLFLFSLLINLHKSGGLTHTQLIISLVVSYWLIKQGYGIIFLKNKTKHVLNKYMSPLRESMVKGWLRFVLTQSKLRSLTLIPLAKQRNFYIFQNQLLNCPDFSNLGRHDIIPELGVLPHHIRSGLARKICVTQWGVYYGKWIHSNLCIIMRSQRGTKGNSMKRWKDCHGSQTHITCVN